LRDLLEIVETSQARHGGFRSLAEDMITTTSARRLIFHVFASRAQFERELISESTRQPQGAQAPGPDRRQAFLVN